MVFAPCTPSCAAPTTRHSRRRTASSASGSRTAPDVAGAEPPFAAPRADAFAEHERAHGDTAHRESEAPPVPDDDSPAALVVPADDRPEPLFLDPAAAFSPAPPSAANTEERPLGGPVTALSTTPSQSETSSARPPPFSLDPAAAFSPTPRGPAGAGEEWLPGASAAARSSTPPPPRPPARRTTPPNDDTPTALALVRRMAPMHGRWFTHVVAAADAGQAPFGFTRVAGVPLTPADFASLGDGRWLADSAIAAFAEIINEAAEPRAHMMDPQFFALLSAHGYDAVRHWGRRGAPPPTDHERLMVPLHRNGNHWTLAVADAAKGTWTHYDPTAARRDADLDALRTLRAWLARAVSDATRPVPQAFTDAAAWSVAHAPRAWPLQTDSSSCGLFVLGAATALAQFRRPTFRQDDVPRMRRILTAEFLKRGEPRVRRLTLPDSNASTQPSRRAAARPVPAATPSAPRSPTPPRSPPSPAKVVRALTTPPSPLSTDRPPTPRSPLTMAVSPPGPHRATSIRPPRPPAPAGLPAPTAAQPEQLLRSPPPAVPTTLHSALPPPPTDLTSDPAPDPLDRDRPFGAHAAPAPAGDRASQPRVPPSSSSPGAGAPQAHLGDAGPPPPGGHSAPDASRGEEGRSTQTPSPSRTPDAARSPPRLARPSYAQVAALPAGPRVSPAQSSTSPPPPRRDSIPPLPADAGTAVTGKLGAHAALPPVEEQPACPSPPAPTRTAPGLRSPSPRTALDTSSRKRATRRGRRGGRGRRSPTPGGPVPPPSNIRDRAPAAPPTRAPPAYHTRPPSRGGHARGKHAGPSRGPRARAPGVPTAPPTSPPDHTTVGEDASDDGSEANAAAAAHSALPSLQEIHTTRIPVFAHVPSRVRLLMRDEFARLLYALHRATGDDATAIAYNAVAAFPKCVLGMPSARTMQRRRRAHQSTAALVRDRLERWRAGECAALWDESARHQSPTPVATVTPADQEASNKRRALRLAREGAYRKALTALTSDGIAQLTDDVEAALRAKHPQDPAARDDDDLLRRHEHVPMPLHRHFTVEEVRIAIERTPPASAAGVSGLSFTHLKEMVRLPCTDTKKGILPALAKFADRAARGQLPAHVAAWLCGAPLTALRKRDEGVRPIAVGESLRRLVGKVLMQRVKTIAAAILAPMQLGVAVRGGIEAIVHAGQEAVAEHGSDNRYGLLQLDFANAFNLVDRRAVLRAVRAHLLELYAWTRLCYGGPEDLHLWCGGLRLRSATGVQQGDPLLSLLFSLALHDLMTMMPPAPAPVTEDRDAPAPFVSRMLYADDGVVVGTHAALRHLLDYLASPRAVAHGVHLRPDKCAVWWPSAPPAAVAAQYPTAVAQDYSSGCLVLQAPVGDEAHRAAAIEEHVKRTTPLLEAIGGLEDGHVEFTLLRACLGNSRVNHLLRVAPPACTARAAASFDAAMETAVRRLVGGVLPRPIFCELQLPVRSAAPSFGVGLGSATESRHAAYLASLALTRHTVANILGARATVPLQQHPHAPAAHEAWLGQCALTDHLPLSAFDGEGAPTQRDLMRRAHEHTIATLPPGDDRTAAHRASLGLPGAKDWISCRPAPGMRTYIADRDFRLWMRFHCRIPLMDRDAPCPRTGCTEMVDQHGDHLLHCRRGLSPGNCPMLWRHDGIVAHLAQDLRRAARRPLIDPRPAMSHKSRPDIRAADFLLISFV